jgi:hypothetical protein
LVLVNWNAACCPPVAASPDNKVSALARLAPVRPKIFTKAGGSAPPLLKKALSAFATLSWLPLNPPVPSALGPPPKFAVRFRIASVAV